MQIVVRVMGELGVQLEMRSGMVVYCLSIGALYHFSSLSVALLALFLVSRSIPGRPSMKERFMHKHVVM